VKFYLSKPAALSPAAPAWESRLPSRHSLAGAATGKQRPESDFRLGEASFQPPFTHGA